MAFGVHTAVPGECFKHYLSEQLHGYVMRWITVVTSEFNYSQ